MDESQAIRGKKILIVDDHRNIRVSLRLTLEAEGAEVGEAENFSDAQRILTREESAQFSFDVVLLDIRLPDGSGLDLLKILSQRSLASRAIMISGEGTAADAFQATQTGAFDYIEKPFAPERIIVSVGRCLEFNRIQRDNESLARQVLKGQEILGQHPKIAEMLSLIKRVAPTSSRVLIVGESGTGKELIAKALHRHSDRSEKPFIKVNCAAIPHSLIESELFGHEKGSFTGAIKQRRGLFEMADQGTLFLDEIGELSADVQAKLLRVLQNGEINRLGSEKTIMVDVRLIAATHRDLSEMVQLGQFREDLFYRLNVVTIKAPALRERKEDIPLLANYFLDEACHEHALGHRSFSEQAMRQLCDYRWPGNVRELLNLVERVAILSETQLIEDIPELAEAAAEVAAPSAPPSTPAGGSFSFECSVVPWQEFHQAADREYIKHVLKRTGGNVSEAARLLCLERAYLHRLMRKLGIQRDVVVTD